MSKTYTLELDKPREIRFGFRSMREIRNKFGNRSLESLMNIHVDEIPFLAWAGLRWDDKQLTVAHLEDMLDEAIGKKYTIMGITEIIIGALSAQMGVETKKLPAGDKTKKEEEKPETVTEKKKPTETIPSTKKQKK